MYLYTVGQFIDLKQFKSSLDLLLESFIKLLQFKDRFYLGT